MASRLRLNASWVSLNKHLEKKKLTLLKKNDRKFLNQITKTTNSVILRARNKKKIIFGLIRTQEKKKYFLGEGAEEKKSRGRINEIKERTFPGTLARICSCSDFSISDQIPKELFFFFGKIQVRQQYRIALRISSGRKEKFTPLAIF